MSASEAARRLDLLDWRRHIFALYRRVRLEPNPATGWREWRRTRDALFASHPQSPLRGRARSAFSGLPYFDYAPAFRLMGDVVDAKPEHYEIGTSDETAYGFSRIATVSFSLAARPLELELYWLDGYGGGLFLPFRDATGGDETYGAGRYLLDTVKGADLGGDGPRLVLDFNFAYNPSCAYDPAWVCPLAPPPNHLETPIPAGERAG
jgi:uncharacterized protein